MLQDEFTDASGIPCNVLNTLAYPATFSVEPSETMFDLVLSAFYREKILKEQTKRKLWNMIVNHSMESMDEENGSARTARYSCTEKLLLEYIESDSRWV